MFERIIVHLSGKRSCPGFSVRTQTAVSQPGEAGTKRAREDDSFCASFQRRWGVQGDCIQSSEYAMAP